MLLLYSPPPIKIMTKFIISLPAHNKRDEIHYNSYQVQKFIKEDSDIISRVKAWRFFLGVCLSLVDRSLADQQTRSPPLECFCTGRNKEKKRGSRVTDRRESERAPLLVYFSSPRQSVGCKAVGCKAVGCQAVGRKALGCGTSLRGFPREQTMLKGHLPRVMYHRVYLSIRR